MKPKHQLHYALFNFDKNIDFKIFLAVLATATMIYKKNGKPEHKQTFELKGFLSKDSLIPRKNINYNELEEKINNFKTPFFDILTVNNKIVEFKFSAEYENAMQSLGFQRVNIKKLKSCKSTNITKLTVLTQIRKNGFFELNYLIKLLNIDPNFQRASKIREIKRAFAKVENVEFFYKHPKQAENADKTHYRFYYRQKKPQ